LAGPSLGILPWHTHSFFLSIQFEITLSLLKTSNYISWLLDINVCIRTLIPIIWDFPFLNPNNEKVRVFFLPLESTKG
jgi:hypothetical protein